MFQSASPIFIYAVSPVHMGAGTALGLIDNPIQREVHTRHPVLAGSGLKGAIRHELAGRGMDKTDCDRIFGPEHHAGDKLHAGAISFSDAQLVAFPVRCLKGGFVWATSLDTLARARRRLQTAGLTADFPLPEPNGASALVVSDELLSNGKLVLETWEFEATTDADVEAAAGWLADNALPDEPAFAPFAAKLRRHLVLLPEADFADFVENACLIEPHVRIDATTGTASDGGLFYTENLPPESLLLSLAMTSGERHGSDGRDAAAVMAEIRSRLHDRLLQVGGDASTGRGQVTLHFADEEA